MAFCQIKYVIPSFTSFITYFIWQNAMDKNSWYHFLYEIENLKILSRTSSGGWTQIRLDWSTSRHHKASKKDEGWYKELNTFPRSLPIGSSQSCPTADVSSKRHLLREGELGTTFCLPSQKARLHLRRWAISQGRKPLIRNCTSLVIKGIPQKEEWVRWGR